MLNDYAFYSDHLSRVYETESSALLNKRDIDQFADGSVTYETVIHRIISNDQKTIKSLLEDK